MSDSTKVPLPRYSIVRFDSPPPQARGLWLCRLGSDGVRYLTAPDTGMGLGSLVGVPDMVRVVAELGEHRLPSDAVGPLYEVKWQKPGLTFPPKCSLWRAASLCILNDTRCDLRVRELAVFRVNSMYFVDVEHGDRRVFLGGGPDEVRL